MPLPKQPTPCTILRNAHWPGAILPATLPNQAGMRQPFFPSFSYEGRTEVKQGVLHLYLDMKVYMLQSSSWVKPGNKDAYCLNHEQKHFDIAKLVAERFKQKITPAILSVADYNSIIQYHFIESFREMNQLQEQYDTETQHGLNKQAQEQWNKRIAEELGSL